MSKDFQALWLARAKKAERAALDVLASDGHTTSRAVLLTDLWKHLEGAPVDVQDYFNESIICLTNKLNRSAIVLAWSGLFSIFSQKLYDEKIEDLLVARPKWNLDSVDELREQSESQIIDCASIKSISFIKRPKARMMDGWLSQRNQCAHPTVYRPTDNEAIGFVDTMIKETMELL